MPASGGMEVALSVEVLSQDEAAPASYPAAPSDLSTAAANIPASIIWQRLEAWIAARWGERNVVWTVQGPGTFATPLRPASIDTVERWDGAWSEVTPPSAPLGIELGEAVYRITATVGSTDAPPEAVLEAYRRLAEYFAQVRTDPASGHTSIQDGDFSFDRPAAWAARAMQYSGAADLLRGYRT